MELSNKISQTTLLYLMTLMFSQSFSKSSTMPGVCALH